MWRRYGSEGMIEVYYSTRNRTSGLDQFNAHDWEDFVPVSTATRLLPGQTSATLDITVVNNALPEDNETFSVILMSTNTVPVAQSALCDFSSGSAYSSWFLYHAGLLPSPRLNAFTTSTVTIKDDDDPHGVFTFENNQAIVDEEDVTGSGTRVTVRIVRQGGLFGRVSVVIRTFGGGEMWTNYSDVNTRPSGQSTQVNVDYQRLNKEVVFQVGQVFVTAGTCTYQWECTHHNILKYLGVLP